ncbi:MAG: hypothetical protein HY217_06405 [Candidatus Rokubacteria bacterium]|nr:hypothetical protein [Candidatus Rokubacteria bacterium]
MELRPADGPRRAGAAASRLGGEGRGGGPVDHPDLPPAALRAADRRAVVHGGGDAVAGLGRQARQRLQELHPPGGHRAVRVQGAPARGEHHRDQEPLAINTRKPLLGDRRVRQALNYAVDKAAIVNNVLFGAADGMDAPMASSLFGYCKIGGYEYNPARARDLLKQAGVKPGTGLQLIHPTGRYVQDKEAAQAIAGYLREVGLEVSLQTMDWPSYIATITAAPDKNTTQLHYLGWAPAFLDASQQMYQFRSRFAPPKGLATSFFSTPEIDRLALAAERELNQDKRKELYCQAARKVWEEAPWVFLWVQRFPIVYSAKVTDISSLPNEMFYAKYARPVR